MFETELSPATPQELSRIVAENAEGQRRPIAPVGGRTALHYGGDLPTATTAVGLGELKRIIDYPARDMTITVEAGLRWETLQTTLAKQGQRLPVDVAQAHRATVGGAIATNTSGPRRFGHGTFRDYVIGISAVDGTGRSFSAGGRVVKNVAGYDFCKLLTGSLGALAIITQVTLKLRPLPAATAFVWACFSNLERVTEALTKIHLSRTRPVIVELLNEKAARQLVKEARQTVPFDDWNLCVGYEGTEDETNWQIDAFQEELRTLACQEIITIDEKQATLLASALTEYQAVSDDPLTFEATLPPSRLGEFMARGTGQRIALQAHAGSGIVIGHLPDSCADAASAQAILAPLRAMAESYGGALVILNCEESAWKSGIDVFGTRPSAWTWMHRLKARLDPHHVLSPGRLPT